MLALPTRRVMSTILMPRIKSVPYMTALLHMLRLKVIHTQFMASILEDVKGR